MNLFRIVWERKNQRHIEELLVAESGKDAVATFVRRWPSSRPDEPRLEVFEIDEIDGYEVKLIKKA